MDSTCLVVLATVADHDTGVALGKTLLEERLAACVQVSGAGTAVYRWQGKLYVEPQVQLIIKTSRAAWPLLRERWVALRADETPELLALPVVDGLPSYLFWVLENTTPADYQRGD